MCSPLSNYFLRVPPVRDTQLWKEFLNNFNQIIFIGHRHNRITVHYDRMVSHSVTMLVVKSQLSSFNKVRIQEQC